MKKILFLTTGFILSFVAQAQDSKNKTATFQRSEVETSISATNYRLESNSARVIWSEDFANGIPAGWSQNGSPAAALWEYRGPNTAPNDTAGSRGAYAGQAAVSSNLGDPIQSPTRSNGFMIFDSDYLDNNGNQNTIGLGAAPSPHLGRLRTSVIDLSAEPDAELSFYA